MFHPIITGLFLLLLSARAFAGGFVIVSPDGARQFPPGDMPFIEPPRPPVPPPMGYRLEPRSEKASVEINDRAALTLIDQTFYNPTNQRLEGHFLLPLPEGAVIKEFSMYINGKETPAELLDAGKARKIYEDIVRKMRDPALLEYGGQNLFKARIFPIEPNSETRVKISYAQILPVDGGTCEYAYPLPANHHGKAGDFAIDINLNTSGELKNVYCPTHKAEILRKNAHSAHIGLEQKNEVQTGDLKLFFNADGEKVGLSLLGYRAEGGGDGYFFLTLNPGLPEQQAEIQNKDITFVLDVSGSMSGEKLEKAKEALLFCVNSLNPGDRFDLIRFSTEARALFGKLGDANAGNIAQARQFIGDLKAIGGTNIHEALKMALAADTRKDRPHMVVFITDGKPTIGVTGEEELLGEVKKSNVQNTRIFTFGIGGDINTHLLDKITEHTRAYRSYILPDEDMEVAISNFYTKISAPVLTELSLDFGRGVEVYEVYPKHLPDLFKGSSVTVLGRYKGGGSNEITLRGKLNGEGKSYKYTANFGQHDGRHEFIPPLWAARAVGYLLDQMRLHGESKELKDEVVKLALKYGIVTPYTSYLILEDETTWNPNPVPMPGFPEPVPMPRPVEPQLEEDFGAMYQKSSGASIRSSREIQQMNRADNMAHTRQGQARMEAAAGVEAGNMALQYRNIQGRAVYQNADLSWTDSEIANQKSAAKAKRVQFASDAWFELANDKPQARQFLALGNNVRFVLDGTVYEVFE